MEGYAMAKNVFILGAGASKEDGGPLMAEFLDVAKELYDNNEVPNVKDFERVIVARSKLMHVHSKADLDIDNMENVFAAFEMAKIIKRFENYSYEEICKINNSIKIVIAQTLENQIVFSKNENSVYPFPPNNYDRFVKIVKGLDESNGNNKNSTAVISFNYDLGLDYSFFINKIEINYGIEENAPLNSIPILKLHGSLNWGKCKVCKKIIPFYLENYFKRQNKFSSIDHNRAILTVSRNIVELKHCEQEVENIPYFVPPTWNKTSYQLELTNLWANAARQLNDAENIFVIGYSLPDSDYFFRNLYALSTISDNLITKFWVFDPDPQDLVRGRYEALLGSSVKSRFNFYNSKFSDAIDFIGQNLNIYNYHGIY